MKNILMVLLVILTVSGCVGVGLVTTGAVMYYKSQSHEVASVDIKSSSENVYRAVLNTIKENPSIVILNKDDSAMLLDLRQNENIGSIKVIALSSNFSKLTITSGLTSENESTPLMVVLKICKDLNVECVESK